MFCSFNRPKTMTHHVAATAAAAAAGETARKVADAVANRWNHSVDSCLAQPKPIDARGAKNIVQQHNHNSRRNDGAVECAAEPQSRQATKKTKTKTRSGDRDNDEIKSGKSRALLSGNERTGKRDEEEGKERKKKNKKRIERRNKYSNATKRIRQ